jgi:hypothetical protein
MIIAHERIDTNVPSPTGTNRRITSWTLQTDNVGFIIKCSTSTVGSNKRQIITHHCNTPYDAYTYLRIHNFPRQMQDRLIDHMLRRLAVSRNTRRKCSTCTTLTHANIL